MISIRRFLVVVILSVVCLTNFLAALRGYQDSLQEVEQIEKALLREKARILLALFRSGVEVPADIFSDDAIYQVWQEGSLISKSENAPSVYFEGLDSGFHYRNYRGGRWLLYLVHDLGVNTKTIVGVKHGFYLSLTEEVLVKTIIPIIWVLPLVGILIWTIVVIGLRPIKGLARELDSRDVNDFSPVEKKVFARELMPITKALNSLFLRLNDAFQREKRFSADAAHELRTPLSSLKINLHNLEVEKGDCEILRSLKRSADRMEHSIEQLLVLNRISADMSSHRREKTGLYCISEKVIVDLYDQLACRRQDVSLDGEECFLGAMPYSLEVLIRNLIDNASKYTPENGVVKVTVGKNENAAFIRIEDSGPGVPESEYSRLQDRFYRVGGDRNNSKVKGSGLGLSIVADIVKELGAHMVFSKSEKLGGLCVTVFFKVDQG